MQGEADMVSFVVLISWRLSFVSTLTSKVVIDLADGTKSLKMKPEDELPLCLIGLATAAWP